MEPSNIGLGRLHECTFEEATQLWNDGFEGYFSDMSRNIYQTIARMGEHHIQPEHSVVAWSDGRPIGFVLLAVKSVRGETLAWNGGTGIAIDHRGKGIGKQMMKEVERIIRDQKIDRAYLEVITDNKSAIGAYRNAGFRIADQIIGMKRNGEMSSRAFASDGQALYSLRQGKPWEAASLSFYRRDAAWESQWHNLKESNSLIVTDSSDEPVGYALYKDIIDEYGRWTSTVLYQCEAAPSHSDAESVFRVLLSRLYGPANHDRARQTHNLSMANKTLIDLLVKEGFQTIYEQYLMVLE
ncbi:GNAT family N-acetyltransferase [Paenibacillus sp. J2TS4]|uniref:GNAT family N-acetyltransferase n=1 Tax=Paenibacillus sp. J2TS4 TaxID=2807194 RepID=UPI001AFF7ABC|nr:GNAT family N-acetyltransferase [Paenibacillus sp. J2TS4]GIP33410.1 hypothetical protein J2TS4_26200 [Paenibacillus sp. J2TS4]